MKARLIAAVWTAAIVLVSGVGRPGAPLTVKNLRCEYKADPIGMDVGKPRLSWELENQERSVLETSYEIRVAQSEADLAKGKLLWDSGRQLSEASIHDWCELGLHPAMLFERFVQRVVGAPSIVSLLVR